MTKGEHTRLVAWRWRLLCRAADDNNVARACRHFGISRKSFYKWKRRLDEHGQAGLGDRARTPHTVPRATSPEIVSSQTEWRDITPIENHPLTMYRRSS